MDFALPELELQQELLRFTTQFADRVTQATEVLERSSPPDVRDEAMRKNLLYVSSAIEIAAGPHAEISLLDMIVFLRLSHSVLQRHWIPELYGPQGGALDEVFTRSEHELAAVAERALAADQRAQLGSLVEAWLDENPEQVRVEGVRMADFSAAAGSAAAERAIQAKGLLSGVKTASHAANQAMLLSERALFLFHRLPFLWRLQARIGAREMLSDAVAQLSQGPQSPVARLAQRGRHLARHGAILVGLLAGSGVLIWWVSGLIRR